MKRFRAPLWAWLVTASGVALFLGLAGWQFQRGQAKQVWLAQFDDQSPAILDLAPQSAAPGPLVLQRARAAGRYVEGQQLLQDGQSRAGRPGYHVWTPLLLNGGGLLVVNRGWIPQPYTGSPPLAAPENEITVTGWWRALPEPGIRLAGGECHPPARFPAVVVYPPQAQLACLLGQSVLPGLLLLDPEIPGGFVREWSVTGIPPERHYGYAVTWLGLALTALVLFITLNLHRHDPAKD